MTRHEEFLANPSPETDVTVPFPASRPELQESWFVCHTRARCEKKFSELCGALDWVHYLPLVLKTRRYPGGHKRQSLLPLFMGYVFARVPEEQRHAAFSRSHLARMIRVGNEPLFLRQLEDVRRVVDCGFEISLQPVLERGSRVRVIEGPLMGMVAQVEDKNRRGELIVSMDVLQQGVRVSLPDSFVELLGEDEL